MDRLKLNIGMALTLSGGLFIMLSAFYMLQFAFSTSIYLANGHFAGQYSELYGLNYSTLIAAIGAAVFFTGGLIFVLGIVYRLHYNTRVSSGVVLMALDLVAGVLVSAGNYQVGPIGLGVTLVAISSLYTIVVSKLEREKLAAFQ